MCMIIKTVSVSLGPLGNVFFLLWMLSWAHKQEFGSWDVQRRKQVCYAKCYMQYSLDFSVSFAFSYV